MVITDLGVEGGGGRAGESGPRRWARLASSLAFLSDLGSCLQAEGEGAPPGPSPPPPPPRAPRLSCLCPVKPEEQPTSGRTDTLCQCLRWVRNPFVIPSWAGQSVSFYFTILPPCKASWPPAADLGLSLPQRGAQAGSETRRSERAWGLPTARGKPSRGVVQMVRRLSPCAGEPAVAGSEATAPFPGPQLLCYLGVLAPHPISHCHWETSECPALASPGANCGVGAAVVGGESPRAGPPDTHLCQSL